jgi:serine/threonine protein kinase
MSQEKNQEKPLEDMETTVTVGRGAGTSASEDLCGKIFAQRYQVLELLGRGGMSVVYKARHLIMDKIVALKVLHMYLARDQLSLRRFKQESQTAATLTHPGIVAIHDCGESGEGMPYLVMDFVEGITLSELLTQEGPLKLEKFLIVMKQVAAALSHAHKCGIIHRDLKPSNIMITEKDGAVLTKIVDFGIAKMVSQSGEAAQQLTQTGEVFGSPLYMSPEQCAGTPVDHRADIYSLGCVMYETLSGRTPFKGESVYDTMNRHMNEAPPSLVAAQLEEGLRQRLELILLRALAKLPADRYQSMAEIESELRTLELKTGEGLLTALGGAWGRAAAKRRAARQNKLPLMVTTLTTVSCLSVVSVLVLLGGLKKSESEIARLEQSRRILSEITLLQTDFVTLGDTGKIYFTSIFVYQDRAAIAKEAFEQARLNTMDRLDKVEKAFEPDPELSVPFKKEWKAKLVRIPEKISQMMQQMAQNTDAAGVMSIENLNKSLTMAKMGSEGAQVLKEMTREARKAEKEKMGKFRNTEQWISSLAFLCAGLNGAVVVSLLAYFARGTPRRLKKLAEQASQLSRKRGIAPPSASRDEVADLDNVLQELATALSEAEEREKFLLQKLESQEKTQRDTGRQK